jgi:RNA polymerase sigma-70 factor (ECF subfamily)
MRQGMDTELVIRAQQGDRAAFAELAVAIGDRLHAVAHRMLRDVGLAEDASQQTLLKAWQELPRLREPERFEAWTYRLLVNVCHAEWRRRKRSLAALPDLDSVREPISQDDMAIVIDRDQLERGYSRLSMDHRAVVVLHYYLDMPVAQIAETLGVGEGTVKSRLYHAMRGLRAALDADTRDVAVVTDGHGVGEVAS